MVRYGFPKPRPYSPLQESSSTAKACIDGRATVDEARNHRMSHPPDSLEPAPSSQDRLMPHSSPVTYTFMWLETVLFLILPGPVWCSFPFRPPALMRWPCLLRPRVPSLAFTTFPPGFHNAFSAPRRSISRSIFCRPIISPVIREESEENH